MEEIRDHFDRDELSESEWKGYYPRCRKVDYEYRVAYPEDKDFIPLEEVVKDIIGGGGSFAEKEILVPV